MSTDSNSDTIKLTYFDRTMMTCQTDHCDYCRKELIVNLNKNHYYYEKSFIELINHSIYCNDCLAEIVEIINDSLKLDKLTEKLQLHNKIDEEILRELLIQTKNLTDHHKLGLEYYFGNHLLDVDYDMALHHFLQCSDLKSQCYVGKIYYYGKTWGLNNEPNYIKSWNPFFASAEKGDKDAQYYIAQICYRGTVAEKNIPRAKKWYELSAEQGDVRSMAALGKIFHFHDKNYERATEWYKKAIEKNHNKAMLNYGLLLLDHGHREEGIKMVKLADKYGNTHARNVLNSY